MAGYLWIAALWLALDPLVGESQLDQEPYRSAHHLGEAAGPILLGAAATFAAYLIGTFFNELRSLAADLYLRARQSAGLSASAEARREVLEALQQVRKQRRQHRGNRQEETWQDTQPKKRGTDRDRVGTISEAAFELARVVEASLRIVLPLPSLLAGVTIDVMEALVLAVARPLIAIRIEPYKPFVSETGVEAIKRYLAGRPNAGPEVADSDVADVIADFPVVRTRLLHRSPDTVNEYDRLRAEADFRAAIFLPLVTLVGILIVKVGWLWGLILLPLLVLLGTARAKRREAGDILADILGSVVQAPSVEARSGEATNPQEGESPPGLSSTSSD